MYVDSNESGQNHREWLKILEMLWSVMRLIFKTSSVTPDCLYVFSIILSFSTCSQSFKKICTWEIWALVSVRHFRCHRNYWYCMVKRDLLLLYCNLCSWKYALITCTLSSFRDFLPFDMLRIKYKSQTLAWTKTKVWLTRALYINFVERTKHIQWCTCGIVTPR